MEEHIVKVLDTFFVTHDVKCFRVEKPAGYTFVPGQATEISINKPGWEKEGRPFTFTNLPDEDILEFTIKIYKSDKSVTNELLQVNKNDTLILHDVFGDIAYKGKGVFIAGGAGITPFIAIIRQLVKDKAIAGNQLIFANKSKEDIIYETELKSYLDNSFVNILESGNEEGYYHGRISKEFLKNQIRDFNVKFYVCGPDPMIDAVVKQLSHLGVAEDSIIKEGE